MINPLVSSLLEAQREAFAEGIKFGLAYSPVPVTVDLDCCILVIKEVKSISIFRTYRPPRSWFKTFNVSLSFSYIDGDGVARNHTIGYRGYSPLLYSHRDLLKSLMKAGGAP